MSATKHFHNSATADKVAKATHRTTDTLISPSCNNDAASGTIAKILDLHYFADLFAEVSKRNDFKDKFPFIRESLKMETLPDLEVIIEFYNKVFTHKPDRRYHNYRTNIAKVSADLQNYLSALDKPAIRTYTYKYMFDVVERVLSCDLFTEDELQAKQAIKQAKDALLREVAPKVNPAALDESRFTGSSSMTDNAESRLENETTSKKMTHPHHEVSVRSPEFRPISQEFSQLSHIRLDHDGFIEVKPKYALVRKGKDDQDDFYPQGHQIFQQGGNLQNQGQKKANKSNKAPKRNMQKNEVSHAQGQITTPRQNARNVMTTPKQKLQGTPRQFNEPMMRSPQIGVKQTPPKQAQPNPKQLLTPKQHAKRKWSHGGSHIEKIFEKKDAPAGAEIRLAATATEMTQQS